MAAFWSFGATIGKKAKEKENKPLTGRQKADKIKIDAVPIPIPTYQPAPSTAVAPALTSGRAVSQLANDNDSEIEAVYKPQRCPCFGLSDVATARRLSANTIERFQPPRIDQRLKIRRGSETCHQKVRFRGYFGTRCSR